MGEQEDGGCAESAALKVWRRQSVWSQSADAVKATIQRARAAGLALGICAAVGGAASAQTMGASPTAGKVLAFAAALAAGCAPLAAQWAAADRVRDWTRLRSVSEALKSELYRRLAGAGPYRTDTADAVLLDRTAALEEDAGDLVRHTVGIASAERALPQVRDTATYAELRLRRQITDYYRPRALLMRRRLATARRVEVSLGAAAAVLAAAGGALGVAATGAWTAVVTTVAVAVVAHAAAAKYDYQELEFSRTAMELERLVERWERGAVANVGGGGDDRGQADSDFVQRCEDVISIQNEAWMVKWQAE
ncbi:DUF4231 domain-containing protein [Streptomyces sp. CA-132043]|uniref:DUF4231 domain-containing protein n=1 Tax=Streptomyces sp. CA-132043 TaxID=3240048 RepID=UPI003D913CE6